ncbi:MAG: sigma-70 family RNA polymerase sigma factor [Oscillospiraceae bacterium]|nr:sigma-70 family RNA polymerase sigma factor [Oscillospiraceae bacterium]MCX4256682.1 sigma-70 family RNA polymerase sigma factor [Oscillospiraceae bacterium]
MNSLKDNSLAEENLGLVHLCANRFRGKGIEYDDLYGAGCVGLVKAAAAFDRDRGVKFSTYAVPVILGEIKRLFRDGGSVKVSRSVRELGMRISRSREQFALLHGREPTVSELAELTDSSPEDVAEAIAVNLPVVSLTGDPENGNDGQIDIAEPSPDAELVDILSLRQALGALDETDRRLIYCRYFKDMTQTRTAEVLGMSQVQVSRREKKLLMILRGNLLE